LHPLDFLDSAEVPELSFFPGMKLNRNKKIEIFHYVMNSIRKYFSPVNMSTYAEKITAQKELKNIKVYSDVKFKQTIISKGN
jgi:hypothetical protein